MANAYIWDYLKTGDKEKLDIAIKAHDNWIKFGHRDAGHISVKIDYDPWRYVDFEKLTDEDFNRYKLGECMFETYKNFKFRWIRRTI